jgi:hypothetical protein
VRTPGGSRDGRRRFDGEGAGRGEICGGAGRAEKGGRLELPDPSRWAEDVDVTDLLARNLAALARRHPELVDLAGPAPRPSLRVGPDPDGCPALHDEGAGWSWYAPSVRASLRALEETAGIRTRRFVVQVGLGLGHELLHLQSLRARGRLLVIEPDPDVFRAALRAVDLRPALEDEDVELLVGHALPDLAQVLQKRLVKHRYLVFAKSVVFAVPEGSLARDAAHARETLRTFREMLVLALNMYGNCPNDALVGIDNILGNLGSLARFPNAALAEGRLSGRPAVVASAGPSLEAHLPLLRDIQDRVPIFCPDTSIRILQSAGVRPHLAASRERTPGTVRHFEELPHDDFALVCFPVLSPRVFEAFRGPTAFLHRLGDWYMWHRPEGPEIDFNGSAGNLAFRVAALLGCDPIILVGQDLCFAEGGGTHASGAINGAKQSAYDAMEKTTVPGNRGGTVETTACWRNFLRFFEMDVHRLPNRVINATQRGAHIRGTEVMTLEDALREAPLGPDPRADVLGLFPPREGAELRAHVDRLTKLLRDTRAGMKEIRKSVQVGFELTRRALAEHSPPKTPRPDLSLLLGETPYVELDALRTSTINCAKDTFTYFLFPTFQSVHFALEIERYGAEARAEAEGDVEALGREIVQQVGSWFEHLEAVSQRVEPLFERGEAALAEVRPAAPPPKSPRKRKTKSRRRDARG